MKPATDIVPASQTTTELARIVGAPELASDIATANEHKADLKARTAVRSTFAVAVAVTDVEAWLAGNPNAPAHQRRAAERARDAFRRKLGEK